jgi:hypothetical protein
MALDTRNMLSILCSRRNADRNRTSCLLTQNPPVVTYFKSLEELSQAVATSPENSVPQNVHQRSLVRHHLSHGISNLAFCTTEHGILTNVRPQTRSIRLFKDRANAPEHFDSRPQVHSLFPCPHDLSRWCIAGEGRSRRTDDRGLLLLQVGLVKRLRYGDGRLDCVDLATLLVRDCGAPRSV